MKRILLTIFLTILFPAALHAMSPFEVLPPEPLKLAPDSKFQFTIIIRAPEGHYFYADDFKVELLDASNISITGFEYPLARNYFDPYLKKNLDICEDEVAITVNGEVGDNLTVEKGELNLLFGFKGCGPDRCFMPETREIKIPYSLANEAPPEDRGKTYLLFPIVFFAGILSAFTPCFWPIIPILLLFIGVREHGERKRNVRFSLLFVGGLALTYAILGLLASAFGRSFGFLFQESWFLIVIILFFLIMSLSLFGFFQIRIPSGLQMRLERVAGKGLKRAFLAGVTTGLIASPCVTPVVVGMLAFVTVKGEYLWGSTLLLSYALGLGIIFLAIGFFAGKITKKIKGGRWMTVAQRILAVMMLLPALYYSALLFKGNISTFFEAEKSKIEWIESEAAFEVAKVEDLPIMVKFGAKWCAPCWKMDYVLNSDDLALLAKNFVALKVDVTNESPFAIVMSSRFKVLGVPTLLFLSPEGEGFEDLTLYEPDHDLIKDAMQRALARVKVEK